MNIALAQINPIVGDIAGNQARIIEAYDKACAQGAELAVFPELCLIGYPPEDLVLSPAFRQRAMEAAKALAARTRDKPAMLIGTVWEEEDRVYNAALLLADGEIRHIQPKTALPNYGIFDEKRLFAAGNGPKVVQWRGMRLGVLVCEDVWSMANAQALAAQKPDVIIVINASPFEAGKMAHRLEVAAEAAKASGAPLFYVNSVGGQDDIVFDGGSFVMDAQGRVMQQLARFKEALLVWHPQQGETPPADTPISSLSAQDELSHIWEAMKLGLADYVTKNGFPGVLLGISGGIDSALTAALAVDALGPARVRGVLLPSPYTSHDSMEDSLETGRLLGIETVNMPIVPMMGVFEEVLSPVFHMSGWMENPLIGGNLQARLRGVSLMALSNQSGFMLLSTGNKSEIAVGYSTLYGDSCGGYNVLKDLYKTQVYALANWRNSLCRAIPQRSIDKAPSAELAPGQKDEDQLPPYSVLDAILERHIEGRQDAAEITAAGFDAATVERVLKMVRQSEYKRRQSCPGVKLTSMMFGRDRRFPLTNKV